MIPTRHRERTTVRPLARQAKEAVYKTWYPAAATVTRSPA